MYSESFVEGFTVIMQEVYPSFDAKGYTERVFTADWPQLELKERMRRLSTSLRLHLPDELSTALEIITAVVDKLQGPDEENMSFEYMFLPDFVEQYALQDYDLAVQAMERITKYSSCEFAIRPYLKRYPEQMLKQMLIWSEHPNAMVRRLASEGSRPRLPWGLGVPRLKREPELTLPILEKLKQDPDEVVRRSVANHLNDISKDHPELVAELAERWLGISENTDKLVRYACRGLLKQSHPKVLALFGLGHADKIEVTNFTIGTPQVKTGEYLEFAFDLAHHHQAALTIRLEYAIYYLKANGSHSRKVFKISEKDYEANLSHLISRRQSFKPITTRVHYPGLHGVSIIANGREFDRFDFILKSS